MDLGILQNNPPDSKEHTVQTIRNTLDKMEEYTQRILDKSASYSVSNSQITLDDYDIIRIRLNDYTQAFRDVMNTIVFLDGNKRQLSSTHEVVRKYNSYIINNNYTNEEPFIDTILSRNELTHSYFNEDNLYEVIEDFVLRAKDGMSTVNSNLFKYCDTEKILDKEIRKMSK